MSSSALNPVPAPQPTARPVKILLVEDNPDDALLLERHLRRNGFVPAITRVETAAGMSDGLRPEDLPEIILADYNLPEFSGPAALQLLKSTRLDIPFIMMSGAVSEQTAVDSMRAGAQDYISKQNLTRLIPVIDRELQEAASRRTRQVAEAALRASEARFHRLVETMPLALLITGAGGVITYANRAAERLLGQTREQIAAAGLTTKSFCDDLARAQGSSEPPAAPFEAVCRDAAGKSIDVLIGVAILNPEAAAPDRQFAAFIADLTRQKQSEEVLRRTEKLAVAGRFAASIAHEINNPLEAVVNCLYLTGLEDLPPDAREYLTLAQSELDRVTQITVQTLRFYRGSTRPSTTDVHELMENVLALLHTRLRTMRIHVERRLRATPTIVAQDGEIRQVIVNLITNALDALGEDGTLVLRTTASSDRRKGRTEAGIAITIADNGSGMSPEVAARIFEPFYSTKGITGTGLGLWISDQIVSKHEGAIRMRTRQSTSTRRGGTIFRLFIPSQL